MKISIITPVLNGRQYIRETVESVLSQGGDFELEYIVRDGGSTDGTLEILAGYRDRCTIVSQPDGSPQDAINAGMAMASGDICAWLNADDLYEPGALQSVADVFRRNPNCLWCYGRCRVIDESGGEVRKPVTLYKNLLGWHYSRNVLLCENFINQPATFWRRSVWEQAGGLSTEYKAAFDYALWLSMGDAGPALAVHQLWASFRRHPGSISENNITRQFDEELAIAARAGTKLHILLHKINRAKILWVYRRLR